jgi:hypothetical protein
MRRAVQALVIGGVLLSAAACGGTTNPAPGSAPLAAAPSAAAPSVDGSIRSSCEALGQVYGKHLAPFAESLTKLVAAPGDKEPQRQVQQSLTTFAAAIRAATRDSTDPQLRVDGAQTADQLQAKAKDAAFLRTVKTEQDVNTVLGPTMKQWLSPVAKHCS